MSVALVLELLTGLPVVQGVSIEAFAGLPRAKFLHALEAEGIPLGVSYPSLSDLELAHTDVDDTLTTIRYPLADRDGFIDVLHQAGIVGRRKEGNRVVYEIAASDNSSRRSTPPGESARSRTPSGTGTPKRCSRAWPRTVWTPSRSSTRVHRMTRFGCTFRMFEYAWSGDSTKTMS